MRLRLAMLLALGATPAAAQMEHVGTFVWLSELNYFGGFSGIELSDDGSTFTVISDSGYIATGRITREDGVIVGMEHDPTYFLEDPSLWPRTGDPSRDSEGLTVDAEGRVFVSYEGITEVREEMGRGEQPLRLPRHPDFEGMQNNGSLEALAIGPDGAIYAIPERSGRAMRPFPLYRFAEGVWDIAGYIPRRGLYLPVGADIAPDGRLYLLERDFNGIGFTSRIRSFALDGSDERELLVTPRGAYDNLEGLSVWPDGDGLRLTMISDDNYRWLQETQVVEYRLTQP